MIKLEGLETLLAAVIIIVIIITVVAVITDKELTRIRNIILKKRKIKIR
jgi:hypothetical protein